VVLNTNKDLYRIGTVASLTGLSVERLRAWERRYDLSPAHKSGKTRFYSRSQLDRLKLIKHLIDQGQPISSLANLDYGQLLARAEVEDTPTRRLDVVHSPVVGLIGPNLLMLEQQAQRGSGTRLDVAARWANMEAFATEQIAVQAPHLMIVQLPVLSMHEIDSIKEFYPDTTIISIYQFASAKTVGDVTGAGYQALKWPLTWAEIEHVSIAELGASSAAVGYSPRRYSDEELIALASETDDPSNCAQYLVEAINQLNAFSSYVEDTSLAMPRSQIYSHLQNDASQARLGLETALESFVTKLAES
jgi:DNA-binding transcriptional MerR regulator